MAWGLLALAVGCALVIMSRTELRDKEVAGVYVLEMPWAIGGRCDAPQRVELDTDGRMIVHEGTGGRLEGRWWWDGAGGWVRSDITDMDRRIRGYRGWTGPRIRYRCALRMGDPEEVRMRREQ